MLVAVKDIKAGDEFFSDEGVRHWTAIGDATIVGHAGITERHVHLDIRWVDGGLDTRVWSDPDIKIKVTRRVARA